MGRKNESPDIPSVNGRNLARVLGVTPGRVSQMVAAGTIQTDRSGMFDLPAAVQAYVAAKCAAPNGEKVTAKARKAEAEADLSEMERDEKAGHLHKDSDIAKVWGGMLMAFRSKMLALPTKSAPQVHGMESAAKVEDLLRKLVNEALSELAEHDPTRFNG